MADTDPVTLADLKTMMEIKTDTQDDVLNLIITNTTKALRFKLDLKPTEDFPEELSYIALEVCIRRYNRRKNEGMTSYEQEGQSFTFKSNDFDDFADDIDDWKDANGKNATSLGTVSFISGYPKR
ncbi:phage head-tail connector protein [Lacticaseibacillus styriensis]|uniref:Phage gp6-like head-tail connector protein n=2 Tax=Lacticaseibacillus TaxID=2759736 RepID=A0AAN1C7L3_LACCA|nr:MULTISPECIES: phage head-tail connector protein [Lacticaseibacillus]ARY91238.1 hypothetical protein BGL52_05560 [Lacticaseibacillus casei]WLV81854.1 phage head-tail connector protein [Lacticaseibacillus sp. NCIMB 15473]